MLGLAKPPIAGARRGTTNTARTSTSGQLPQKVLVASDRNIRAGALTDAEVLFQPLSRAADVPDWARGYMSLLADSTNSSGSMQKHLVRLLAKGAANTNKVAQFVANPGDSVTDIVSDVLADKADALLQKHIANMHKSRDSMASVDGHITADGHLHALDDVDACNAPNVVDPMHGKVLSLMVSVLMSGAVSGVADAVPLPDLHLPTTIPAVVQQKAVASHGSFSLRFGSFTAQAPSLSAASFNLRAPSMMAASHVSASGASSMLGAGGMAASTAMKMLRADSKVKMDSPDISNLLGTILDAVSESTDELFEQETQHVMHSTGRAAHAASASFRHAAHLR